MYTLQTEKPNPYNFERKLTFEANCTLILDQVLLSNDKKFELAAKKYNLQ